MKKILLFTTIFSFVFTGICFAFGPSSSKIYNGIDVSRVARKYRF